MNKGRIITILVVGIVSFGFFIWLTNSYVFESEADQSHINIVMSPKDGDMPSTPVSFTFQPVNEGDKISSLDLKLSLENAEVTSWEGCKDLNPDSDIKFDKLLNEEGSNGRYTCVVLDKTENLPNTVVLPANISCTGEGTAKVTIQTTTQVSGPVEGDQYVLNDIESAEFTCDGSGTPAPDTDITTSFSPSSCSTDVGGECTYDLNVTSQEKKISGFYVKLAYDSQILNLNNVKDYDDDLLGVSSLIAQATSPSPSPTGSCTTNADCTFLCPSSNACNAQCVIPTGQTTGTCVSPGAALTPTTTPVPSPSITSATDLTPTVVASPTGTLTVTPEPSVTIAPMQDCSIVALSEGDGILEYLYVCDTAADQLPTSFSNKITFDAVSNGDGDLTIDAIQVVGPDVIGAYSVTKGKGTYSIGGGAGEGNLKLDLELRLQCVVKKPKRDVPVNVRVGIGDGPLGTKKIFKTGEFTFDDDGHLVGTVGFDAPAAGGYRVYIKTDTGMQKKVCDASPTEDFPAAYRCDRGNISLENGSNTLDFSNIILLTGDLPPGEQNGIKNSQDYALVRSLIGKRDEESASLADVNYDTVVNAVDHSCMIFDVRWDEE